MTLGEPQESNPQRTVYGQVEYEYSGRRPGCVRSCLMELASIGAGALIGSQLVAPEIVQNVGNMPVLSNPTFTSIATGIAGGIMGLTFYMIANIRPYARLRGQATFRNSRPPLQ